MNIIIEKAKVEDKPFVFSLLKQANMHYIPSQEMPALSYDNYFVAKMDGKVVGFCGYKVISTTEAKTELMVVDTKYRGKGIGKMLQVARMEDMLQKGIKILTTNTDSPKTIEWYKKHFGYKQIGKLKKYHEFADPQIDHWTVLQTDLSHWDVTNKKEAIL